MAVSGPRLTLRTRRPRLTEVTIPLRSHDEAILVLGPYDRHAKLLRQVLAIEIHASSGNLKLSGLENDVFEARRRIDHLLGKHRKGRQLAPDQIDEILGTPVPDENGLKRPTAPGRSEQSASRVSEGGGSSAPNALRRSFAGPRPTVDPTHIRPRSIEPRSQNQRRYLEAIERHALTFGLGAAGTGKTYLAAAAAVRALRSGEVRRLIITRPVVEAGERLGFLPGDLQAKLDPYLRPIYDALYDILSFEDVGRLEEAGVIEVAPLAFMRGRTLSHAFVILDEAQNTTVSQMKMFLTRLGERSRMVVTGDPSQSDLDRAQKSGLGDAVRRLRGFQGIAVVEFSAKDIVRHPLVEQIVRAYEQPLREETAEPVRPDAPRGGETRAETRVETRTETRTETRPPADGEFGAQIP